MPPTTTDFSVQNCGSLVKLWALSEAAQDWADENLPEDRMTVGKWITIVEPRYIADIVEGIKNDGLTVNV